MVYAGVLVSSSSYFVLGIAFMTGLLYFNLVNSSSLTAQLLWCFWYTQDILIIVACAAIVHFLPATWLLLVLFYRMDLVRALNQLQQLIDRRAKGQKKTATSLVMAITEVIVDLEQKADHINRFSGPLLSLLMACSSTVAGICLFLCVFTEIVIFRSMFPVIGLAFASLPIIFEAVAGDVSEKSNNIHALLCRLTGHRMDMFTNARLLMLMERVSCDRQRLALYTASGDRCTSLSLIVSLLETGVQFSLLYNFSGYLKLTGIY